MKATLPLPSRCKRATLLALALGAFALSPSAARAGDQVPFRATWDAEIQITPLTPPWVAVSGAGQGHGDHLGRMTAQSIAEVVDLDIGTGIASYRFTAANRDEVLITFVFTLAPTSPTTFAIQGDWEITGGSGRFLGASGSGAYVGQVQLTDPASALGHFELAGTISSPGSLNRP